MAYRTRDRASWPKQVFGHARACTGMHGHLACTGFLSYVCVRLPVTVQVLGCSLVLVCAYACALVCVVCVHVFVCAILCADARVRVCVCLCVCVCAVVCVCVRV